MEVATVYCGRLARKNILCPITFSPNQHCHHHHCLAKQHTEQHASSNLVPPECKGSKVDKVGDVSRIGESSLLLKPDWVDKVVQRQHRCQLVPVEERASGVNLSGAVPHSALRGAGRLGTGGRLLPLKGSGFRMPPRNVL